MAYANVHQLDHNTHLDTFSNFKYIHVTGSLPQLPWHVEIGTLPGNGERNQARTMHAPAVPESIHLIGNVLNAEVWQNRKVSWEKASLIDKYPCSKVLNREVLLDIMGRYKTCIPHTPK